MKQSGRETATKIVEKGKEKDRTNRMSAKDLTEGQACGGYHSKVVHVECGVIGTDEQSRDSTARQRKGREASQLGKQRERMSKQDVSQTRLSFYYFSLLEGQRLLPGRSCQYVDQVGMGQGAGSSLHSGTLHVTFLPLSYPKLPLLFRLFRSSEGGARAQGASHTLPFVLTTALNHLLFYLRRAYEGPSRRMGVQGRAGRAQGKGAGVLSAIGTVVAVTAVCCALLHPP